MAVTLRQLEYFVTVVDEGSFTRAAARLHVTQPGLSHQFQAMEKAVGGPLLERLPRQVRLTPAGRAMLPHARATLADAARASTAALRASGVKAGELHVATLYSISLGILPEVLRIWRREYADIRIRLFEYKHVAELAAAMEAGQADVAIGPPPLDWTGPIRDIGAEEFVIVTSTDDPLGGRNGWKTPDVAVADLADRDWVHFTQESGLANVLDNVCTAAGFTPRIAVRTEQGPSAAKLAAAGLGLTLVPGNILPPNFDGHLLRPNPPVLRPLSAYTRGTPDPITAAFVEAFATDALVTPPHIRRRISPA